MANIDTTVAVYKFINKMRKKTTPKLVPRGIQLEDYDKKNHLGSDYTILDMEQRKNKARNSDQLFDRTPEASAPLCRINVSGKEYVTTKACLENYPDTLLGNPVEREKYFRPDMNAYYFNRSRKCFETILAFYQTGRNYQVPDYVCLDLLQEEKEFFKIPEPIEAGLLEVKDDEPKSGGILGYCSPELRRKGMVIFRTIMDPTYSRAASVWHTLDIVFICISITFMILETDPYLGHYFAFPLPEDDEHEHDVLMIGNIPINNFIFIVESLLIMFFTLDILTRFITWPGFLTFWKNIFNILDILSIFPFYISLVAHTMHPEEEGHHDEAVVQQKYLILKMCRIFRIVRVFKFVKHSRDLIVIVKVLLSSRKELGLLVILLGISTVTFGSIIFYVENETNGVMFNSIMTGCWWALVTITTLGYGDIHPKTVGGKIIGAVLLTFGMVFLTLPMTIIVSKFGSVYETENRKLYSGQESEVGSRTSRDEDSALNPSSSRSKTFSEKVG